VAIPERHAGANLAKRGIKLERVPGMELTYSYFAMNHPVIGGYTPERIALRRAIAMGNDVQEEIRIARKNQASRRRARSARAPPATTRTSTRTRSSTTRPKAKALLDMFGYVDCNRRRLARPAARELADECKSVHRRSTPPRPDGQQQPAGRAVEEEHGRHRHQHGASAREVARPLKASHAQKLQMWGLGWSAAVPDADSFFVMLYGPNGGQANHSRFKLPEFDRLYEQAKALPDGPERNAPLPRDEPPLPGLHAVAPRRAPLLQRPAAALGDRLQAPSGDARLVEVRGHRRASSRRPAVRRLAAALRSRRALAPRRTASRSCACRTSSPRPTSTRGRLRLYSNSIVEEIFESPLTYDFLARRRSSSRRRWSHARDHRRGALHAACEGHLLRDDPRSRAEARARRADYESR
jgi:hypothetical protein